MIQYVGGFLNWSNSRLHRFALRLWGKWNMQKSCLHKSCSDMVSNESCNDLFGLEICFGPGKPIWQWVRLFNVLLHCYVMFVRMYISICISLYIIVTITVFLFVSVLCYCTRSVCLNKHFRLMKAIPTFAPSHPSWDSAMLFICSRPNVRESVQGALISAWTLRPDLQHIHVVHWHYCTSQGTKHVASCLHHVCMTLTFAAKRMCIHRAQKFLWADYRYLFFREVFMGAMRDC